MRNVFAAVFVMLGGTANAIAGVAAPPVVTGGGSEQETALFAGINWTFGADAKGISVRLGAIYTDSSSDSVSGARAFVDYNLAKTSLRFAVTGFSGDSKRVGEIGLGYDLTNSETFGLLGAMGDYTEMGLTYGFGTGGLEGYIGLNSIEFEGVEETVSCVPPEVLINGVCGI